MPPRTIEIDDRIRDDGKPALIFASHLANWELPALAAPAHGLDAAILYRRPNIASADRIIQEMRQVSVKQQQATLLPLPSDKREPPRWRDEWVRFTTILRRAFVSKLRNRANLWTTIFEAPLLAALIGFVLRYAEENKYDFASAYHVPTYLFLSLVVAMFLGLTNSADEITVVDAPSEESVLGGIEDNSTRLAEKHKLSRLRELALLVAASVVDRQLESYLKSQGTEQTWGVQERILVCVTEHSDAAEMLASGRRNADRFQGEFYVVHVQTAPCPKEKQQILENNLRQGRELGAEVHLLNDTDPVTALLEFATQRGITQIFVGRSSSPPDFWTRLRGNLAVRLIRAAEGIDVIVYPHR